MHNREGTEASAAGYWVATVIAAATFVVPGFQNLLGADHVVRDMSALGYPAYFPMILGTWKVLGGVAILAPRLPRLKEWAYAGMFFDLSGAIVSRAVAGDGLAMVLVPGLIGVVVGLSWWLRPADRVLQTTDGYGPKRGVAAEAA